MATAHGKQIWWPQGISGALPVSFAEQPGQTAGLFWFEKKSFVLKDEDEAISWLKLYSGRDFSAKLFKNPSTTPIVLWVFKITQRVQTHQGI